MGELHDPGADRRQAGITCLGGGTAAPAVAELEKDHRIHQIENQIREQKTLDMLISQAKISDEDPERLIVTPDEARAQAATTAAMLTEAVAAREPLGRSALAAETAAARLTESLQEARVTFASRERERDHMRHTSLARSRRETQSGRAP